MKQNEYINAHNAIITQAKNLQSELQHFKDQVEQFYGGMRWTDTHLSSEEYGMLYPLVRCMEDTGAETLIQNTIEMLNDITAISTVKEDMAN